MIDTCDNLARSALPVRERYHKLSDIKSKNTPNIWLVSVQGEVAQPGAVVGIHRNTSGALLRESGDNQSEDVHRQSLPTVDELGQVNCHLRPL